jgi:hypothetical protein
VVQALSVLPRLLLGQLAASVIQEELTGRAEVAGLPNSVDDSAALTDDVQVRRKGALGRALLSVGGIAEPHRASDPELFPILILENNILRNEGSGEVGIPGLAAALMERALESAFDGRV